MSFARLRRWASSVKRDVRALALAARDPRVPWYAKLASLAVVAYALSPIDLIPDFIPVIGYLDDLIIVPAGILLVVKLIPPELLSELRQSSDMAAKDRSLGRFGAMFIVLLWILCTIIGARWFWSRRH